MITAPWRWLGRHRWIRRAVLTVSALWFTLISIGAGLALADGGAGQAVADPLLSWMTIKDTHGVPIYAYQISGPTTKLNPIPSLWLALANMCWQTYATIAAYGIWFIDWVNGFSWFGLLNDPATSIAGKFSMMLAKVSLGQAFMVIAGLMAFLHYGMGRKASAVYELVATWIIAALAVGALSNPIGITGGDNGWIMQARSAGLQAAGAMITPIEGDYTLDTRTGKIVDQPELNVSTDTQALQSELTSSLVDVFLRWPNQLVNYGKVLDDGPCESAYTDAVKSGPYRETNVVMDKIKGCDQAAGDFADNPSLGQGGTALGLTPAAITLILLALALAGGIITSVALILYKSVKMLWSATQAMLPGRARMGFFMDLGEMAAAFILLVVSVFFLAIYIYIITDTLKGADSKTLMKTFVTTDIVLILLLVIYKKQKEKIQAAAAGIASFLATRPGGGVSPTPPRRNWAPAAAAVGAAATASRLMRRGHHRTPTPAEPTEPSGAGTGPTINAFFFGGRGAGAPGASPRERVDLNIVPNGQDRPKSTRQRLLEITAKTAGQAALGHATGGASTAAIAAMRVRKAALAARAKRQQLVAGANRVRGALPGGPQPRQLGPGPSRPGGGGGGQSGQAGPRSGRFRTWMRNRRGVNPSQAGYSRVQAGGSVVLIPQNGAAGATGRAPFWRRRG